MERERGGEGEEGKGEKRRGRKVHKISPFFRDGEEGKSYFAPRSNYYRQLLPAARLLLLRFKQ